MCDRIALFLRLVGVSFRSQMQHKASFFMHLFSHFLSSFVSLLGTWVLFERFQIVRGWTFAEVAIIYGIVHMGFALAEATARSFDKFDLMVKHGEFDRILLRPRGTLFQIASRNIDVMRIGRFFQGLVVLWIGVKELSLSLSGYDLVALACAVLSTACLFYGLFILQATISFWTTESLELMNIATYGGMESSQYPMTIYPEGFRLIFTLLIPLACVAYYPVATILGHESFPYLFAFIFPSVGVLFLLASCLVWRLGVRRYSSTGN